MRDSTPINTHPVAASAAASARAERLLKAPIVSTLLRLAAPGVLLMIFQSAISITDTYFVGQLGTAPLAGLALVFPLVMLLQMTSAGAMGGGVASAVARALGAGRTEEARALGVHALLIGVAMGLEGLCPLRVVNELLVLTQPAHLQRQAGMEMAPPERNIRRAQVVRERLAAAERDARDIHP